MPPTPYTPDGKLRTTYIVGGITHHYDVPVNIGSEAGNDSTIINYQPAQPYPGIQEAGDAIWDLVRVFYTNTVAAPLYTLFKRDVNIFIPLGSEAATNAGASATAYSPCTQMTFTFRDDLQYLFKLVLMETINPAPNHGLPSSPASVVDVFEGFTLATAGLEPHDFVRSLADNPISRSLFWTVSDNRKLRRARGLL